MSTLALLAGARDLIAQGVIKNVDATRARQRSRSIIKSGIGSPIEMKRSARAAGKRALEL